MSQQPENCTHDCSTCGADCPSRDNVISKESLAAGSKVKKVIGVISGKGGVGKSTVTALLASALSASGKSCAVLDADMTGPSIPRAFGLYERATASDELLNPAVTPGGIKVMSLNLLLESPTDPVVWRGPVIAGAVKQFWSEVNWGEVDYMFVDMPPGTGDVPLTVFQSLPVDGVVVVTTPQDLVGMIVEKAVNMAKMMNVPVLGLVENMSWFECPDCKSRHFIFGRSRADSTAARLGIGACAALPVDPELAKAEDAGELEGFVREELAPIVKAIQ